MMMTVYKQAGLGAFAPALRAALCALGPHAGGCTIERSDSLTLLHSMSLLNEAGIDLAVHVFIPAIKKHLSGPGSLPFKLLPKTAIPTLWLCFCALVPRPLMANITMRSRCRLLSRAAVIRPCSRS